MDYCPRLIARLVGFTTTYQLKTEADYAGVFVANLDGTLIIASSQQIASEFNVLSNASWLITSFVLALCASQPLVRASFNLNRPAVLY